MPMTTVSLALTDQQIAHAIGGQEMILLPLKKYQDLLARLENLQDALDLKTTITTSTRMVPWDDVVAEYEAQHV